MTNLFSRVKDNLLADFHNILDEKESKSPISMLNQYLRNCENETKKVEALIKRQTQIKEQFSREKEQARFLASKRSHQADIAAKANETELETRARQEAEYYTNQAAKLTELQTKAENDIYQLENQLQDMKLKLKEMNTKRLELMSRENVAHASRRVNASMYKLSEENPFFRFEEVEQQIQDLEMRINAEYEHNTFDMRIARIEKELQQDGVNS